MKSRADLEKLAAGKLSQYLQAYAFGLASVDDLGKHGVKLRIVGGRPELTAPGQFKAADLRWGVQSSDSLGQWGEAGGSFVQQADPNGLKLLGQPLASSEHSKFYRLNLSVDPGQLAGSTIAATTGSAKYGMSGNANWNADADTGALISTGGNSGETNRIISSLTGPAVIDFEMAIVGGNWDDSLVFFIDGVKQSETYAEAVRFRQTLSTPGKHLLMWEFTRGSGKAVIRNLAQ